uniref:ATOH1 protein n=1 Tax=Macrostomum lignano TaxID=282301 RepID=A0A1I8JSE1_9PLAT
CSLPSLKFHQHGRPNVSASALTSLVTGLHRDGASRLQQVAPGDYEQLDANFSSFADQASTVGKPQLPDTLS